MNRINRVQGIKPEEAEKLTNEGITTVTLWWEAVGESGFQELETEVGIPADRMIELLANEAIREDNGEAGTEAEQGWAHLKRNWLVIMLGFLIALAAVVILRALASPGTVVMATSPLGPLDAIEPGDVATKETVVLPGNITTVEDVLGRYTLEAIPQDSTLHDSQVTSFSISDVPPSVMADRRIISLPIQALSLPAETRVIRAALLFAPHSQDAVSKAVTDSLILEDVIILATDQTDEGSWIVAAIKTGSLEAVARHLGVSDVYILRP
jgi:hypothetical protein